MRGYPDCCFQPTQERLAANALKNQTGAAVHAKEYFLDRELIETAFTAHSPEGRRRAASSTGGVQLPGRSGIGAVACGWRKEYLDFPRNDHSHSAGIPVVSEMRSGRALEQRCNRRRDVGIRTAV